jgi:hypothetical protein
MNTAACAGKKPEKAKGNPLSPMYFRMYATIIAGMAFFFLHTACAAGPLDTWRTLSQNETLTVYYKDRVVGNLSHSTSVVDTANAVVVTTTMDIEGREAGMSQVSLVEERWYNADGSLRSARQKMTSPIGSNTWNLSKTQKGWSLAVEAGGATSTSAVANVNENLTPTLLLYKKARLMQVVPGDRWNDTTFEMVSGRQIATVYRCSSVDKERNAITFDVVDDISGRKQQWVLDKSGKTLLQELEGVFVAKKKVFGPAQGRTVMGAAGAVANVDIAELSDIFNVPKDRPAGEGDRIALVLPPELPVDESAAFLYLHKDGRWVLQGPGKKCVSLPARPGDTAYKKLTLPTVTLQSNDTAIVHLSEKLRGNEKDACACIKIFNRYVYSSLEKRNAATFSSALETLKAGFGDCGEHAVLLAALLRSTGIPAHVVLGLYYYGPKKAYVGHAWVMAWTGAWVFSDPAFGIFPAGNDRIPLIIDDTGGNSVALVKFIGKIGVEYVKGKGE